MTGFWAVSCWGQDSRGIKFRPGCPWIPNLWLCLQRAYIYSPFAAWVHLHSVEYHVAVTLYLTVRNASGFLSPLFLKCWFERTATQKQFAELNIIQWGSCLQICQNADKGMLWITYKSSPWGRNCISHDLFLICPSLLRRHRKAVGYVLPKDIIMYVLLNYTAEISA